MPKMTLAGTEKTKEIAATPITKAIPAKASVKAEPVKVAPAKVATESDTGKPKVKHEQVRKDENPEVHSTGSDDVLTISSKVTKQKKLKKRVKKVEPRTSGRRLKFDLN